MGALLSSRSRCSGQVQAVLIWIGINLVFTFTVGGISWQGHLGGLVGGRSSAPRWSTPRAQHRVAGASGRVTGAGAGRSRWLLVAHRRAAEPSLA